MQETQIIWRAAGRPHPFDTKGDEIHPDGSRSTPCARCGEREAPYSLGQLISSNFLPTKNANRLRAFGGSSYCSACIFCARTLRLRCIAWIAREDGVSFWETRSPQALSTLLDPPRPPFVVGIPLYGIRHGGEAHWRRTWWPNEDPPSKVLVRLQSKHTALYGRTSYSQDRYPVQVDDNLDFVLVRDLWLYTKDRVEIVRQAMQEDGVSSYRAKEALRTLRFPLGSSPALAKCWPSLTQSLRHVHTALWWGLFCNLSSQEYA